MIISVLNVNQTDLKRVKDRNNNNDNDEEKNTGDNDDSDSNNEYDNLDWKQRMHCLQILANPCY